MNTKLPHSLPAAFLMAALLLAPPAVGANDNGDHDGARARLSGYREVPALATAGSGLFEARLASTSLSYELSYRGLGSPVTQAHIHFGQKDVNGGVSVFLCSNLAGAPAGTQACPNPSGSVRGTITAANVIGPAGQGIAAGEFDKLAQALRAGVAYVNVHTQQFPGGEIRAQLRIDD